MEEKCPSIAKEITKGKKLFSKAGAQAKCFISITYVVST